MALLPQAVLPSGVNYRKILPPGLGATTNEVRIYPTPGAPYSFTRQNQITLRMQDSNFLDTSQSYLYIRVRNDCTSIGSVGVPAFVDGSAHSLFQSLRVTSPSGEQIEYIEEYGRLQLSCLTSSILLILVRRLEMLLEAMETALAPCLTNL